MKPGLQSSETVEPTVKLVSCANGFSHTPFAMTGGAEQVGAFEAVS
jgi:hypothetical protein